MNVRRREGMNKVTGSGTKNTMNQMKATSNRAQPIKNAIGLKPTGGGYAKIKGAVSG